MMQNRKKTGDSTPLFQHLGGTSAEKLARYGRPRADGKSLSRTAQLICGSKTDLLFVADSGPGETNEKGLIVPRFGKNPENHVSVSMTFESFSALMLMTKTHYAAWLTAFYMTGRQHKAAPSSPREETADTEKSGSAMDEDESDSESSGASSAGIPGTGDSGAFSAGHSSGKKKVSEDETGRLPYQQTERVSEGSGGGEVRNDTYEREHYEHAAHDVERLLDKMAERAACEQLENDRLRELNDVAQSISYGNIHKGVGIRVNRIATVDEELVEQYYDFDQDYYLGLATILKEVIQEAEHVEFTACDDYDGAEYLLFEPLYPWQICEEERFLTEEKIAKLLRKYIQILSDSVLEIEYQSVENGG